MDKNMPKVMLYERVKKPRRWESFTCAPKKENGATIPYLTLNHSILAGETIPHYISFSLRGIMRFWCSFDHSIKAGEIKLHYNIFPLGWRGIMAFGASCSKFGR